jgi:hypothetical protein
MLGELWLPYNRHSHIINCTFSLVTVKIRLNRAKRQGVSKSNSNISIEEPIERNNYGTASIRSILEKNSNEFIEHNKMESHAIK